MVIYMVTEDDKKEIMEKLDEISDRLQKLNIAEYIELVRSPRRMLLINFIAGLARGLGVAIGATFLGAIFLVILFRLARLNLPLIGEYIARIVKIVQTYL
ncbi:DUF5665 domain-containing protein [Halothermothrix orenii]|nr:DUF5665 domain-containing protein [Halothermothrix orenii]